MLAARLPHRRLLAVVVATSATAAVGAAVAHAGPAPAGPSTASATAAAAPTVLRLDGIGPLKLGMRRAAAVRTGWLSDRGTGCELGGPPLPITYSLQGPAAPAGVRGSAQFDGGRLTGLSFSKGVRTTAGVTVGTSTVAQMTSRYRARGYRVKATFSSTFGGTFVEVRRNGRQVIGGFAAGRRVTLLALPRVRVCE